VFANRWTIQASDDTTPRVTERDYYIVSPEIGEILDEDQLNDLPYQENWQVFSADTWHLLGDFLIRVTIECHTTMFPSSYPSVLPTLPPSIGYPCIYLNSTDELEGNQNWIGIYTKIEDPELKNGKIHYSGLPNNELY
jgi:hypothetical protein